MNKRELNHQRLVAHRRKRAMAAGQVIRINGKTEAHIVVNGKPCPQCGRVNQTTWCPCTAPERI